MIDHITIDVSGIADESSLHECLSSHLGFPDYYGCNWDAFDECIRNVPLPKHIIIVNMSELENVVPRGASLLKKCLNDFSIEKNKDITITFC